MTVPASYRTDFDDQLEQAAELVGGTYPVSSLPSRGTDMVTSAAVVSQPVPPSPTLRPEQRRLIQELVAGKDMAAACEAARVGRSSAYRWLGQPTFAAALREADREVLIATSRRLARISGKAVQTLLVMMSDPTVPAAVRVRAADSVLSKVIQLREAVEFDERLSALESAVREGEPR